MRSLNELIQNPRSLKALVAGGCALVLLAVGVVGAPALVRAKALREARARGFEAQVESVRFGPSKVWLVGVRLTVPGEPFELSLNAVALSVFSGEVSVLGGKLKGAGDPRHLTKKLRSRSSMSDAAGTPDGPGRDVRVEGLYVRWGLDDDALEAFGAKASRVEGAVTLGADLVRATGPSRSVEARGLVLGLGMEEGRRRLLRLETRGLEVILRPEGAEDAADPGRSSLVRVNGPTQAAAAQRVASPPSQRSERLRALRAVAASLLRDGLAEGASLALDGVSARIEAAERLSFGPSRLAVIREREAVQISLSPTVADEGVTPLALSLTFPLGGGPVHVVARGGPVSLASLGVRAGQLGLRDVERATLAADGTADFSDDFETVELDGKLALHGLVLDRKELSSQPVGPWSFDGAIQAEGRLDGSELRVTSSALRFGDVRAELTGVVQSRREHRHVEGRLRVPLSGCQSVVDAMPAGLMSQVRGMKLSGSFGVDLQVRYDEQKPQETRVALAVRNECRVQEVPSDLSARRFERPFLREVKAPDGTPVTIEGGPGTASWVSLDDVSRYMETAVLLCEDGRFHSHGGFDFRALESAIEDDLKQGRFARGASTVSMQLAKNLYLGQEKTLGRKLQEALFTLLLEQQLDKRRILELYLNIVELGPGLYGVSDAAQYYFATPARALTLGQALYLASILPNPTASHFNPDGKLSQGWQNYLRRLMRIARQRDHIDDAELEAGLAEELAFRVPGAALTSGAAEPAEPPSPSELDDRP